MNENTLNFDSSTDVINESTENNSANILQQETFTSSSILGSCSVVWSVTREIPPFGTSPCPGARIRIELVCTNGENCNLNSFKVTSNITGGLGDNFVVNAEPPLVSGPYATTYSLPITELVNNDNVLEFVIPGNPNTTGSVNEVTFCLDDVNVSCPFEVPVMPECIDIILSCE